uniref:Survival of motor neuron-related-splicing factor 30 n=1 Tax=Nothobranchius korthausae TaxID=1143690 RepID=A0A1A8GXR3_9TELE
MSEDLSKQLSSYKAQLQQVEVALSTDQENEDLRKLQKDLQEVIDLTKDLITSQPPDASSSTSSSDTVPVKKTWKVGDKCLALWCQDGQVYEAEIEEVDRENGTAAVTFSGYGNAEVIPLHNLKAVEERKLTEEDILKSKSKKEQIAEQREYKKKKAQKKVQRMKELEQEREEQKSKWQQFNNKAYSKNKKGQVKRSIFASPESVNGKVGVGTCGIADKPMTQYNDTSKYNVRHLMPQ